MRDFLIEKSLLPYSDSKSCLSSSIEQGNLLLGLSNKNSTPSDWNFLIDQESLSTPLPFARNLQRTWTFQSTRETCFDHPFETFHGWNWSFFHQNPGSSRSKVYRSSDLEPCPREFGSVPGRGVSRMREEQWSRDRRTRRHVSCGIRGVSDGGKRWLTIRGTWEFVYRPMFVGPCVSTNVSFVEKTIVRQPFWRVALSKSRPTEATILK